MKSRELWHWPKRGGECRFVLGEGIKKKEADLAKDVEEQTKRMQEAAAARAAEGPKEEAPPEPTEEQVQSLQVLTHPRSDSHFAGDPVKVSIAKPIQPARDGKLASLGGLSTDAEF